MIQRIDYDMFPLLKEHYSHVFTHPSLDSNSRFELYEFVGDRVISLIVANKLCSFYTDEGLLSKKHSCFVQKKTLASFGAILALQEFIAVKGEISLDTLLADGTEALFGGIFFSFGLEEATNFWNLYEDKLICANLSSKAELQEFAQKSQLLPKYITYRTAGTIHEPIFRSIVELENYEGKGYGNSIKKAEDAAAKDLLTKL